MTSIKKYKDKYYNKYDGYEHIYCRTCGHSCYFKQNHETVCSYCGTMVYPSKRCEFKSKLKIMLRKELKNNE